MEQDFRLTLRHNISAPSISGQKGQPTPGGVDPDLPDEAGPVYGIPNYAITYTMTETPVPLGWMRSVYALQAAFALESFIDELAVAAGKDPLQYRLKLLAKDQDLQYFTTTWKTARMRGVLQLAAEKAGWDKPLPAGHYRGIACFGCFASYMAEVVEITMEKMQPRVHRVVAVGRLRASRESRAFWNSRFRVESSTDWPTLCARRSRLRKAAWCRATSTTTLRCAWTKRRWSRSTRFRARRFRRELASPRCRRSLRRCAMQSTPRPGSEFARCRFSVRDNFPSSVPAGLSS